MRATPTEIAVVLVVVAWCDGGGHKASEATSVVLGLHSRVEVPDAGPVKLIVEVGDSFTFTPVSWHFWYVETDVWVGATESMSHAPELPPLLCGIQ
jgi:hypothetical protein